MYVGTGACGCGWFSGEVSNYFKILNDGFYVFKMMDFAFKNDEIRKVLKDSGATNEDRTGRGRARHSGGVGGGGGVRCAGDGGAGGGGGHPHAGCRRGSEIVNE